MNTISQEFEFSDSIPATTREYRLKRAKQIPQVFINEPLDWTKWEVDLPKLEKDTYLKRLSGNDFFPTDGYLIREDYHLIDFNGDQKLDVIYAGRTPIGGEIDNFAFFENQGDSLRLILKLLGSIIEIEQSDQNAPIDFVVWEWPCCAQQMHQIHYYDYYKNDDSTYQENKAQGFYTVSYAKYIKNRHPNFSKRNAYLYAKSTYLPKSLNFESEVMFRVKHDSTALISNPHHHFEPKLLSMMGGYIPEGIDKSFRVALLDKGQNGKILKQLTINDEPYYFVQVSVAKLQSDLDIGGQPVENLLGWIKATAVDKH